LSPYGYHKLLSEKLLLEYHRFFGLKTCSLRVFSAYGEGLQKQLFWDLFQKSKKESSIVLFGTGNESRDFIYILDLVSIVELVLIKAPFEGEKYNVANGDETSIRDAAEQLFQALDPALSAQFNNQVKEGDPLNWKADISMISSLGYKRKYSFAEGIKKYSQWLKGLE
jgi:dTDP-glucose 4,6-dehydratase/UDP-glucose 4-epimerase